MTNSHCRIKSFLLRDSTAIELSSHIQTCSGRLAQRKLRRDTAIAGLLAALTTVADQTRDMLDSITVVIFAVLVSLRA
jgi:hypothetical protein